LLRFTHRAAMQQLLAAIYEIDVFISVAAVAAQRQYVFPVALEKETHRVQLEKMYHPLVRNAVANTLCIQPGSNIVFLTGANMAGKSTFMKSLGIAVYLAHMGFPVAAEKMEFSVLDGLYTTINLADDLSSGNSHFYAEVMRVKKMARELAAGKRLLVIFDELFRGTNVKDAFEGTVAITAAFARQPHCLCVISTHIIEAADVLAQQCANIHFVYLPTRMNNHTPVYTYRLEQGVTADRHGMLIIQQEGILEILQSRKNKSTR
ncbi:MAG TPA: DNA mismatch repair protein, partial [Chitinophaga sp.]